ncbi:MAG: hypothetical protein DMF61_03420 [Blastocatellia bacterium AA13]|nr:MAG: hypothetical protein DMF61_03420 [Blastocatellia bacterium AA13]
MTKAARLRTGERIASRRRVRKKSSLGNQMTYTGVQGPYHWIEDPALTLSDLLRICPSFVLSKYLILTSFDGRPLQLTRREYNSGWMQQGRVAINPRVESTSDIPLGAYDEWFLFKKAPLMEEFKIFVNDSEFSLRNPLEIGGNGSHGGGSRIEGAAPPGLIQLQELFWMQLELKSVETYIARGNKFILATTEQLLYEMLVDNMKLSSEDI